VIVANCSEDIIWSKN